jgi:hypothetical protein
VVVTVAIGAEPEVELVEPDDFTRFHVAARGVPDRSRLSAALTSAGAGELDGDEVLVSVAWLRQEARGRAGAEWDQGFAGMLDYAERKGWTDASRRAVRAHVEWGQ